MPEEVKNCLTCAYFERKGRECEGWSWCECTAPVPAWAWGVNVFVISDEGDTIKADTLEDIEDYELPCQAWSAK